jgi:hypothetical protein
LQATATATATATAAWPGRGDGEAGLAGRSDLGDNLATFLAARLSGSFDNLSCKDYGLTDPRSSRSTTASRYPARLTISAAWT